MLKYARLFNLFTSAEADITPMANFMGWYPKNDLRYLREAAQFYGGQVIAKLNELPLGYRTMQARWVLQYEGAMAEPYGADPLPVFENGGFFVGRNIMMYKPLALMLKERGMNLDAIYIDFEAGFSFWNLDLAGFRRIFASAKARANMPPRIRNYRPEQLTWGHPEWSLEAGTRWHNWQALLIIRALRRIFIDSGLYNLPRRPGGPPVLPQVMNFNYISPTWRIYDPNGWPQTPFALVDNRTSCRAFYFHSGGRYANRTHHELWNCLIDYLNWTRSILNRADSRFWPVIVQPVRVNPWLMEQLIAHLTRTGCNWAGSRSAFIYFSEMGQIAAQSDPIMADIMREHDHPFPRLQGLPEIPLDADRIETAGFVTTYEDFINNVTPGVSDGGGNGLLTPNPLRIMPYSAAA